MPVFVALIWGAFLRVLPSVTAQVLIALGISAVTYTGVDVSLEYFKNEAISNAALLPPDVIGMLATMKVGNSVNMVFSAIVARMLLNGVVNGAFKRWVTK